MAGDDDDDEARAWTAVDRLAARVAAPLARDSIPSSYRGGPGRGSGECAGRAGGRQRHRAATSAEACPGRSCPHHLCAPAAAPTSRNGGAMEKTGALTGQPQGGQTPPIVDEYKLRRLRNARVRWRGFGALTWGVSIVIFVYFTLTPAGTPRQLSGQQHVLSGVSRGAVAAPRRAPGTPARRQARLSDPAPRAAGPRAGSGCGGHGHPPGYRREAAQPRKGRGGRRPRGPGLARRVL